MTEQRMTRVDTSPADTQTHTTIVTDQPRRSGAGTWLILIVLVVLGALAFMIFNQMTGAEVAKDNAIAGAAGDVGAAASQVGDAAQDVAQKIGN